MISVNFSIEFCEIKKSSIQFPCKINLNLTTHFLNYYVL